jgi:hypothetical protein
LPIFAREPRDSDSSSGPASNTPTVSPPHQVSQDAAKSLQGATPDRHKPVAPLLAETSMPAMAARQKRMMSRRRSKPGWKP